MLWTLLVRAKHKNNDSRSKLNILHTHFITLKLYLSGESCLRAEASLFFAAYITFTPLQRHSLLLFHLLILSRTVPVN